MAPRKSATQTRKAPTAQTKNSVKTENQQTRLVKLSLGSVFAILGILLIIYLATNALFKSQVSSHCKSNMAGVVGERIDCDCVARVVSGSVSFPGKLQILLVGGSLYEVLENIPVLGLLSCVDTRGLFD